MTENKERAGLNPEPTKIRNSEYAVKTGWKAGLLTGEQRFELRNGGLNFIAKSSRETGHVKSLV